MTNGMYPTIDHERSVRQSYDVLLDMLLHMPDSKTTKPTTKMTVMPLVGDVRTHVIRTNRSKEYGFVIFVEIADAEGLKRIALPDSVAQAIYRQRQSLTDRSTPESRARAAKQRLREKQRKERETRRAAYAARQVKSPK